MKVLKIEVPGYPAFIADLLYKEAPKTCDAFCAALPYRDAPLGHAKWSGCVISLFTDTVFGIAENSRGMGVCPGDILFNPHVHDAAEHPNEASIVYGPAAMRTFSGFAIANLFARVRPEYLDTLAELGNEINRHGMTTVTITAEEIEI